VATHTTQIGNGSGVTSAAAWRTALSVPSNTETVLDADFTGANQSLATSGYQKLPGGLIMQWGTVPSTNDGNNQAITFPLTFPTAVTSIQVTGNNITTTANAAHWIANGITTAGFTARFNSTMSMASTATWFAVGY